MGDNPITRMTSDNARNSGRPSMAVKQNDEENSLLLWLEIAAAISSLIGTAGLIALMAQDVRAEGPNGFHPGARPFTNLFANATPPAAGGNFFDDDEDEDFTPPQRPNNPPPTSAANGPGG